MAYGTYGSQQQVMTAQQAQGRNTNSIMAGWIDRGPWQYWDTVQGSAGAALLTSYSVFSVPIGQQNPYVTGTSKGKLLTNMQQSGTFPPPRCLLLLQLGFFFGGQSVTGGSQAGVTWTPMFQDDIVAILNASYMEFRIDDKIFHEGQLWQFPPGVGMGGATAQSGQAVWTNGLPAPCYSRRYGDWSKYIAPLQLFSMTITIPGTPPTMDSNGPGLYMPVFMDGLTDRSVQ
jgi:hypothetical protein